MAPPRGLEPRTWWLHVTRNYFRTRTISLPSASCLIVRQGRYGSRCIVSEPSPHFALSTQTYRMVWCPLSCGARLLITLPPGADSGFQYATMHWRIRHDFWRTILLQFQPQFPVEAALIYPAFSRDLTATRSTN